MDLSSLGKEPVQPDQPTGSDIRYEPEFEKLEAELDKLSSPSASGTIDWNNVVKMAADILSQKSKHLMVASYLAVGLIHTRQMEGLAIGLRVYLDLLTLFWDDLYPPKNRLRGRIGAIEWWLEKTEAALSQLDSKAVSAAQLSQLKGDLEQLDKILKQLLEKPPSIAPLHKFIKAISPPKESVSETAPQPPPPRPREEGPPTKEEEISSSEDATKVFRSGLERVRKAAAYLFKDDPRNANAYRWKRISAWSRIEVLPPATDGKTLIPPPSPDVRDILGNLRAKGDWEALLNSAEERLSQFIFWLGLNQYVSESLVNLGDGYQAAHDAVCQETAFFIKRLPGVVELHFSDDTPFAEAETKQWLKSIGPSSGELLTESISVAPTTEGKGRMEEEIRKAQELAKNKKLIEAVELLQQGILKSASQGEKLLWRLALSKVLLDGKKFIHAAPHLDQILQDIQAYRLEEWDPDLALKSLKLAHIGFDALSEQSAREKAANALQRIVRLDPAEALRFAKGK